MGWKGNGWGRLTGQVTELLPEFVRFVSDVVSQLVVVRTSCSSQCSCGFVSENFIVAPGLRGVAL